jgi:hypothetical protein
MANNAPGSPPIVQPNFDPRIKTLRFPLTGGQYGTIQRGFMVWEKPVAGYSGNAYVQFLYNPSTVTADYYTSNSSTASAYLFPTGFDQTNLTVPLNQSVEFSLLFDRTYELWGQYNSQGLPSPISNANNPSGINDPSVYGVLVDIEAMQQFTGMNVAYSSGNPKTTSPAYQTLIGHQGIMQLIPSFVFFGGPESAGSSLQFYGYVSEWDVTVTHWTQYMVPMRCVINITFTMLPPTSASASSPSSANSVTANTSTPLQQVGYSGTSTIPATASGR